MRHPNKSKNIAIDWKRLLGIGLVLSAILGLISVYQWNYSKSAVEKQFISGIKNGNYLKAAAVIKTPLTEKPWTDLDVKHTLDHYQEAKIDFLQLLQDGDLEEGIDWQGTEIAKVERLGSFMLIFPKYAVNLHAFPIQLALSNEYRDLKIIGDKQVDQTIHSKGGIQIEPRIQTILIQYSHQGRKEEVMLDLDYNQLQDFRHHLSLVPVTNRLVVDRGLIGLRPDLPFELVSFTIDGQEYPQKKVELSGFVGQSFDVSLKAKYNNQMIRTDTITVSLKNANNLKLDFSTDQSLKLQIQQAELNESY